MPPLRKTEQRAIIRKVLHTANRPLSPQEILTAAQRELPQLGIATVYRAVKQLTEDGALVVVELPGEPQRYEVSGKGHHHHFSCDDCGGVFELVGCPGNLRQLLPPGFTMQRHEVFVFGSCAQCGSTK